MKKYIFLVLITVFLIGLSISLFSEKKSKLACTNIPLSEQNYIKTCRLTAYAPKNFADRMERDIKARTFCRCIFRTFNVRIWADKSCHYGQRYAYSIMKLSLYNMDVQEHCGHLRP